MGIELAEYKPPNLDFAGTVIARSFDSESNLPYRNGKATGTSVSSLIHENYFENPQNDESKQQVLKCEITDIEEIDGAERF
jgi:hypothetical protein